MLLIIFSVFSVCVEYDIRLVDGSNDMEGRIEICLNDTWTSICNILWTTNDGNVACRQLGYSQISEVLILSVPLSCFTLYDYRCSHFH